MARPRQIIGRYITDYACVIYEEVALLRCYPELLKLLIPYGSAKFNSRWKEVVYGMNELIADIIKALVV